jgi:PAS domain S-box-containing protein
MYRPLNIYTSTLTTCCRRLAAMVCLLLLTATTLHAYNKSDTIVVACDWDFAPYEFNNIKGEPDGYMVEVLGTILQRMGLKHEFRMRSRRQVVTAFRGREADIIIDYRNRYRNRDDYFSSVNILGYYRIAVASRHDTRKVEKASQLKDLEGIVVNNYNDSLALRQLGQAVPGVKAELHAPREALGGVVSGQYKYFIWGEEPLKWKIKELGLKEVELNDIDLPFYEIHVVGLDQQLINEIDSYYARMEQSGEIERLNSKWFHPERQENNTSPIVLYITLGILLVAVVMYLLYRIIRNRVRTVVKRNEEIVLMMHQALNMGNYAVLENNLRQNKLYNLHGKVLPEEGLSLEEMMEHVHPDDREAMMGRRGRKVGKDNFVQKLFMRWNEGTADHPEWLNVKGFSFPEFDEYGKPKKIVIVASDATQEVKRKQQESEMASRYLKMFETSLVAMSFYDKNGYLVDMNEKMKELCGITSEQTNYFRKTSIFELPLLGNDFNRDSKDVLHACQHMRYSELGIDKYIELRVGSVFDTDGILLYYVVTARDVTEERNMYMELAKQNKALQQTAVTNRQYEKEMRELLENCNMYVWHVDIKTRIIYFSRSLDGGGFAIALEDYANLMYEEDRLKALANIENILSNSQPFNVVHHFFHTPVTEQPEWFSVSGMPLNDENGNLVGLFGVVRNVTTLMETQEQLKEETARAENSALLKATFLANMTHEIRTPLNAIVGFSDLLHMVDATEERKEFIRIIRNNCDMLMRLINDIFEASTMDVKPLEIVLDDVDFAVAFNDICQSLEQRVQEPGVQFIVENPYKSFYTRLDKGRMQQVITNFVTNAVKYTHQGHIRVGYKYVAEEELPPHPQSATLSSMGIYMYCEDTGVGIPKEKQKKVFDRFVKLNDYVQGTGLGLSICKSIAERSNGLIGVESEGDGQGSTFWIWVPCHEMKSDKS